jgi:exonuclease VII small subunit
VEIDKAQRQGGAAGASPLGDGYVEVHAGDDGLHQVCAEFENGVAAGADEVVNNELKSAREQISRMTKEAEKVLKVDLKP